MAKRKADTDATGQEKRRKTSAQRNAPKGAKTKIQSDSSKTAATGPSKHDKKFNNWLNRMKKQHRKQVHKAKDGHQINPQWEDKRKSAIERLRAEGLLKAGEEGDFGWPADIPSSKYEAKPAKNATTQQKFRSQDQDSETEDEDALATRIDEDEQVASSAAFHRGHNSAGEHAVMVQTTAKEANETPDCGQDRNLWSGSVVARLADITGGENTRPELILKLNIQICQESAKLD